MRRPIVIATHVVSLVGIVLLMSHFWSSDLVSIVQWALAAASGVFCVYSGIIYRPQVESATHKALLLADAVIGGIILLGLILSAIFLFAPPII